LLSLPLKSEILNQSFLDHVARNFQLSHKGQHGIQHWLRVIINGRFIAKKTSINLKVLELFAILHDSRRWSDGEDSDHGMRAAEYSENLVGKWFEADKEEMRRLRIACRYHSDGKMHPDPTIQACWDSNRLDLGRKGIKPESSLLGIPFSKKPETIQASIERSKQNFGGF